MKYIRPLLIIFSCLAISHQASAKVFKWTDEQGQIHYSEQPSTTQTNQLIKPKTGHSDPVYYSSSSASSAATEVTEITATPAPAPKKNPEACAVAKKNQSTLQTSVRVQVVDDAGKYHYLTPEELTAKKAEADRVIKEHCL